MNTFAAELDPELLAEIVNVSAKLPPLPSVVRYFDDFSNETRSIRWDEGDVVLHLDGARIRLELWKLGPAEPIMRQIMTDWLSRHDPHTVAINTERTIKFAEDQDIEALLDLMISPPHEARTVWTLKILPKVTASQSWALRCAFR
ncbi:hypothetical protein CO661_34220 [Sinorhizobium fredii]|uniref:Uncharacterized protein n=1 Tax=Rhizobium fredii TaxID=380 RepID=A0A2A6LMS6_RHIFR|nr:hypothetical protein [Sinorhizobium fredii]PDT42065.1 hypothetical protein CO661_34220 [Sinorhizobium fredii]